MSSDQANQKIHENGRNVEFLLQELECAKAKDSKAMSCIDELHKALNKVVKENEDLVNDVKDLIASCERKQEEKAEIEKKHALLEVELRELKKAYHKSERHYHQTQQLWKQEKLNLEKQACLSEARILDLEEQVNLLQKRDSDSCKQPADADINPRRKSLTKEIPSSNKIKGKSRRESIRKEISNMARRSSDELTDSTAPSTKAMSEFTETPTGLARRRLQLEDKQWEHGKHRANHEINDEENILFVAPSRLTSKQTNNVEELDLTAVKEELMRAAEKMNRRANLQTNVLAEFDTFQHVSNVIENDDESFSLGEKRSKVKRTVRLGSTQKQDDISDITGWYDSVDSHGKKERQDSSKRRSRRKSTSSMEMRSALEKIDEKALENVSQEFGVRPQGNNRLKKSSSGTALTESMSKRKPRYHPQMGRTKEENDEERSITSHDLKRPTRKGSVVKNLMVASCNEITSLSKAVTGRQNSSFALTRKKEIQTSKGSNDGSTKNIAGFTSSQSGTGIFDALVEQARYAFPFQPKQVE